MLMVTDLEASGNDSRFPPFQVLGFNFMKIFVALWKRRMEFNETAKVFSLSRVHVVVEGVATWNCSLLRM
jgi:hypothetical protein